MQEFISFLPPSQREAQAVKENSLPLVLLSYSAHSKQGEAASSLFCRILEEQEEGLSSLMCGRISTPSHKRDYILSLAINDQRHLTCPNYINHCNSFSWAKGSSSQGPVVLIMPFFFLEHAYIYRNTSFCCDNTKYLQKIRNTSLNYLGKIIARSVLPFHNGTTFLSTFEQYRFFTTRVERRQERLLRVWWMPHRWKCWKSGWTRLWATGPRGRCVCLWQRSWTRSPKVPSNPNHPLLLWTSSLVSETNKPALKQCSSYICGLFIYSNWPALKYYFTLSLLGPPLRQGSFRRHKTTAL